MHHSASASGRAGSVGARICRCRARRHGAGAEPGVRGHAGGEPGSAGRATVRETQAFDDAHKGFIAPLPPGVLKKADGTPIWNPDRYAFVKEGEPAPDW